MRSIALVLALVGCSVEPAPVAPTETTDQANADSIAQFGVTGFTDGVVTYIDGAEPYRLATPLFSDYAIKQRAVILPEGQTARVDGDGVLDFPVGTVILKTFLFPEDLRSPDENVRAIETRVLVREDDGWDTWPYLWNDEQTDAERAPSGAVLTIEFVDEDGNDVRTPYLVPQRNQCVDCHELTLDGERQNVPIGPKPRNLAVDGQWDDWVARGIVEGAPDSLEPAVDATTYPNDPPAEWDPAYLEVATRDYLDVNCAHCHNPQGTEGVSSQLFLNWDNTDAFNLGVCKKPGSAGQGNAGLTYDIVPGEPEQSILWYRTQTETVGEMMPDIGRALRHDIGVDMIDAWIRAMDGSCDDEAPTKP